MIFVFARWHPSQKIRMDLPTIYYIPCNSMEVAEKLTGVVQRFGAEKGSIIDLASMSDLKEYVSNFYQLTDFELSRFPVSTNKLLEG